MKHNRSLSRALLAGATLAAFIAASASAQVAHNVGYRARIFDGSPGVPHHPDQSVELALKVKQPFTVVGLGDLLEFQPFANSDDPDVRSLLDITRGADVTTGDFENEIMDFDEFGHAGI